MYTASTKEQCCLHFQTSARNANPLQIFNGAYTLLNSLIQLFRSSIIFAQSDPDGDANI